MIHIRYMPSYRILAVLLSWSQGCHLYWQSLPSPLGVFPPCPWLRTPFQPSKFLSPVHQCQFSSPHSLAWPQVPMTEVQPWADVPIHPQRGDSWSGFLAEPDYSLLVCPSPLLEDCGAGPLQSGWESLQISNEHLTFHTQHLHASCSVCILYFSSVLIKMLTSKERFNIFHESPPC